MYMADDVNGVMLMYRNLCFVSSKVFFAIPLNKMTYLHCSFIFTLLFVKISEAFTQQVCVSILDNIILVAKCIWKGNYILTVSTFPLGTLSIIILGRSHFIRYYGTYIVFCNMAITIILWVPKIYVWHFRFQLYAAQLLLSSNYLLPCN